LAPRVGLFVTCLVDLIRPSVGFAAVRLLEAAGCEVIVPLQSCCGQPAYNSGDEAGSRELALRVIEAFSGYDYVVAPSGSCAAMLRVHYPRLFAGEPARESAAKGFAERVYELTQFLADVRSETSFGASFEGRVAYHDSCSGLRELGISGQPRRLLDGVEGVEVAEIPERETCCGFGGLFSVKYPQISGAIADKKASAVISTGAPIVVGGDLGCLMNIAGRLGRLSCKVECRHVAEILAGDLSEPPIGAPREKAPGKAP
jgi:L-lactate dehydrogenase complex protein LldE